MAKSKYIKTLTEKDKQILNMSSVCGWVKAEQAKNYNGISSNRLNQLANSGYLEKTRDVKTNCTAYKLSDKSKEMYSSTYTATSIHHDKELTNYYINNARDDFEYISGYSYCVENNIDPIGAPDMVAVLKETREIVKGIEVVTSNYKPGDIELKETWSENNNVEVEYIKST